MDNQRTEPHPPGPITLPAHAFSELSHGLKLAFALSFDQGIDGQHLRTAIGQFLYHLELSGSDAGEQLRTNFRQLSRANARRLIDVS